MSAIKIKEGIYSVGVLNPNMRIFDVIMRTDYGTSYNAYLITGIKNILIDTVHARFFDEYLENIRSIIDPSKIDYVIMNHNEPDHSGSLAKLLEIASKSRCWLHREGKSILTISQTDLPQTLLRSKTGTLSISGMENLLDLSMRLSFIGPTRCLRGWK